MMEIQTLNNLFSNSIATTNTHQHRRLPEWVTYHVVETLDNENNQKEKMHVSLIILNFMHSERWV